MSATTVCFAGVADVTSRAHTAVAVAEDPGLALLGEWPPPVLVPDSLSTAVESAPSDEMLSVVAALLEHVGAGLGRASLEELTLRATEAMGWAEVTHRPDLGSRRSFAMAVANTIWRRFCAKFDAQRRERELRDEQDRASAVEARALSQNMSESAVCRRRAERTVAAYLIRVEKRVDSEMKKAPRRWRIPNCLADEVVLNLRAEMLAALDNPTTFHEHEKPGDEAMIRWARKTRDKMRTAEARKRIVSVDALQDADPLNLAPRAPSPEELVSERAKEELLAKVIGRADAKMSRIQRGWFSEMRAEVESNEKGRLNMAAVADRRGKSRSTASRMLDNLREIIVDEARAVGLELENATTGVLACVNCGGTTCTCTSTSTSSPSSSSPR